MKSMEFHGKMKTTNIFFVRHGESYNNCLYEQVWKKLGKDISDEVLLAEEASLRQADCSVSDRGLIQAKKLGEYARNKGFHREIRDENTIFEIYSSPMKRCLMTSYELYQGIQEISTVKVIPNLYESCGCYDQVSKTETIGRKGYTKQEVEELFPGFVCESGMEGGWYPLPVMEPYEHFVHRTKEVVDWIWTLHDDGDDNDDQRSSRSGKNTTTRNIIIVAHGNLICVILNLLLKASKVLFSMNNTGVTFIQLNTLDSGHKVVAMRYQNRIDHLLPDQALVSGSELLDDHWIQEYIHYVEGI